MRSPPRQLTLTCSVARATTARPTQRRDWRNRAMMPADTEVKAEILSFPPEARRALVGVGPGRRGYEGP